MFPNDTKFEAKFTLETEKAGVIEEPPFHILFLGDWSGDGEKKDLSERRPIEIDRDNFDEVMQKLHVRLVLNLHNDGNSLSFEFTELDDFHPDVIFRKISLFSELRDLRKRLSNGDTFNSAAREVRSWFDVSDNTEVSENVSPPVINSADSENLLDQILSGNRAPVSSPSTASSELSGLLSDLVKPHLIGFDENEQSRLISAVDSATSDLMRTILHHPKFQELESTWRGLHFLIKRTETDSDLKIFILNASKTELTDNLKSVNSLADSFLYRWLFTETVDKPGGDPLAVICGNYAFNTTVEDIAVLIRISKISALADAPFISHIRPDLIGIKSFAESPSHDQWNFSDETEQGKLWATLRSLPESEYLGLAIPRFLARLPYGFETDPLDNFAFEEFAENLVHNQYLWSNSAFACALLLARSFRKYGWEMARSLEQDIEGLPTHICKIDGEIFTKPCSETVFTQTGCEKLMDYGLMPLLSFRNTDRVRLARFQNIVNPVSSLPGKWR